MAASVLHLPQELVDSIIEYVGDDRSTLCSCALVSRSWLHSSRYHLFANISLSPHIQGNIPPQQLCAQLYGVLQESPAIVPYIRSLQIFDGGLPPHRTAQWISNERTLPPLLKLLTHLRQLELSASSACNVIQWKSLPFTLQNAICTLLKLPSLTYLRLHSWTFPNLASIAAVLSSCQHLKCLSLSAVAVCEDLDNTHHSEPPDTIPNDEFSSGSDTANTRAPTPSLEVLTLDYVNFGYLGYWLFAPPSPISFSNLRELRISHSADPLVVEQILLSIGPSLEHLHLKPGSWDVFPFDLRNNLNLKSLRLTLEVPETALSWCTTLLSSLSPSGFLNSLTHISLEFFTDLKRLSASSPSTTTTVSPSTSPYHVPLKQVDIGLFAQPSHPDFVRVQEALGGIQKNDLKGSGAVRVYQLGLKSQRSFGRICGPRLRSFEGNN
ncbi:hypothetical protein P691DRAFT_680026 [Macrolepiota fuliginosa MF-IS2]|uniref:F-box domain-containing protein n=1 Tax=Macrolepiota fuliginosa MF-IS2 TaxID=1400762 RepID=A0A9P5X5G5_9AGAR|nr:hypothetical protein P691DRAFT_680026 [Macrolepiota fuliginosa MF-IS2]